MEQINMTDVQAAGEYARPAAGAYKCKITNVVDVTDRKYLKISYDIDAGEFKGYYTEMRENHPDWDWAGAYVRSYKPTALGMLKRFCNEVTASNDGYTFDAGEVNADESTLIGKRIGLLFQEEEYYGNDGNLRTRLKVYKECAIDDVPSQKVPPIKRVEREPSQSDQFEAVNVNDGTDTELPFA